MSQNKEPDSTGHSSDVMKLYEQLGTEVTETTVWPVVITMDGHLTVRSVNLLLMKNQKNPVALDETAIMKLEAAIIAAFNLAVNQVRASTEERARNLGILI